MVEPTPHLNTEDFIRRREIHFVEFHPDPDQAGSAARFLQGVDGVIATGHPSPRLLLVEYDLLEITLEQIESALGEIGLHIDNRLVYRLKRALHYYTESTLRANLGCAKGESNCTRKVFVERYRKLEHGCRDRRPEHWRRYL